MNWLQNWKCTNHYWFFFFFISLFRLKWIRIIWLALHNGVAISLDYWNIFSITSTTRQVYKGIILSSHAAKAIHECAVVHCGRKHMQGKHYHLNIYGNFLKCLKLAEMVLCDRYIKTYSKSDYINLVIVHVLRDCQVKKI